MQSFWQETHKVSVLQKLRKTITLDAFCVRCGEDNGSIEFFARLAGAIGLATTSTSLTAAFTVEFWYKTSSSFSTKGIVFGNGRTLNADLNVEIAFHDSKVKVTVLKGGVFYTLTSQQNFNQGDWGHLAVTYDGASIKIYFNGVQDTQTLSIAAPLDTVANNIYTKRFGSNYDYTQNLFVGFLGEFRIWSVALSQGQVDYNKDKRKGKNANLLHYFRFNTYTSISGTYRFADYLDPTSIISTTNQTEVAPSTTVYPPLHYGASMLAGRYAITVSQKFSLKFPVLKPEDAEFMLCVAWVDDDDVFHRMKLWDQDGVTIWPKPERYRGEVISESFWLEVWGQDGAEECELEDDLELQVSKTTIPAQQNDTTEQKFIDDPTLDYTIAEEFPLTPFPLTFASAQFGTCSSPVTQNTANMSANLTTWGGADGVVGALLLEDGGAQLLEDGGKILLE